MSKQGNKNHKANPNGSSFNRGAKRQGSGNEKKSFDGAIPSPYNFVPLSDKVVFPEWSHLVSQDVPFKDGISGHIDIEIEAVTPIYIRNGGDHPEKSDEKRRDLKYQDFFKVNETGDSYAIPGTSLKGVIRSVLEIVSFSRLSRMNDKHLAFRDLNNQKLFTSRLTKTISDPAGSGKKLWEARAKAGFLIQRKDRWILFPCDYSRVTHSDLESAFQWTLPVVPRNQTVSAELKYKQLGTQSLEIAFKRNPPEIQKDKFYFRLASELKTGPDTGTLVFTGQPNDKKSKEFIFHDINSEGMDVTHLRKQFSESHMVEEKPSESWKFWRPKFNAGQAIPVFYLPSEDGDPLSIGLAQMYRLPFQQTLAQALPPAQKREQSADKLDFAQTLFGYVEAKGSNALKGRISFETAKSTFIPQTDRPTKTTVLGGPKASFYPNYIDQKTVRNQQAQDGRVQQKTIPPATKSSPDYETLNDSGVNLRGWKCYPLHNPKEVGPVPNPPANNKNEVNLDTVSQFKPLPAGTKFQGRIVFHNLRPVELGGLLWVLQWGGDSKLCHSVGMAKPHGFGAIQIKTQINNLLSNNSDRNLTDDEAFRKQFEEYMETALRKQKGVWRASPQLRELLAMVNPEKTAESHMLVYPQLDPNRKINDFVEIKKAGAYLLPYSTLVEKNPKHKVSLSENLARLEKERAAQCRISRNDIIESTGAELRKNKRGKESWRILFQVNGENLEGLLSDQAKQKLPSGFGPQSRYRFKIISFSEADYRSNIILDFADESPTPLP